MKAVSHCYLADSAYEVIARAQDWDTLRASVLESVESLSVCDFLLKLEHTRPQGASGHLVGSLSDPLLRMFAHREGAASDPVNQQLQASAIPFAWQPERLPAAMVYQQLARSGIRHGLSLIMRGANTVSRIDFYGRGDAPLAPSSGLRATFVLLGAYMHRSAEHLHGQRKRDDVPLLSKREMECIKWSAAGKTCAEIGMILGIERRTAYFHLNNVAAKLQVYSTRRAISRAAELGLLE